MKRAFKMKLKTFFIIFKGISLKQVKCFFWNVRLTLKTQRQISDFLLFGVSLVEVPVQDFRLVCLIKTYL